MCLAGAQRLERFDKNGSLQIVDLHDSRWAEHAADRFSPEDLFDLMRVQLPDGTWRSGYFAWAAVFEELPSLHALGLLMRFPLLYGLGPSIYRWIADHRIVISRVLGLPDPCDTNGTCRIVR
jgi:predicted DCC family thiol-disulfide oxidoreductase YuxK